MVSLSQVSTTEFREALTTSAVRTSQLIYFALAAGTSMFALVVLFTYFSGRANEYDGDNLLANMLTAIHLMFTIFAWTFGKSISERQFSEQSITSAADPTFTDNNGNPIELSPAQKCLAIIRTASIIRLGILQGAAFFGLVTSMTIVTRGIAQQAPMYLLNMASAALFVTFVGVTFPTAEKLETTFEKYFHNQ